jgi:hypothetical protein
MPKAAVHEDGNLSTGESNVWSTFYLPMQAVTRDPRFAQPTPNSKLWTSAVFPVPAHRRTSAFIFRLWILAHGDQVRFVETYVLIDLNIFQRTFSPYEEERPAQSPRRVLLFARGRQPLRAYRSSGLMPFLTYWVGLAAVAIATSPS